MRVLNVQHNIFMLRPYLQWRHSTQNQTHNQWEEAKKKNFYFKTLFLFFLMSFECIFVMISLYVTWIYISSSNMYAKHNREGQTILHSFFFKLFITALCVLFMYFLSQIHHFDKMSSPKCENPKKRLQCGKIIHSLIMDPTVKTVTHSNTYTKWKYIIWQLFKLSDVIKKSI